MSQQSIRIAITGGGIAGATLLHALLPHPNLDVHIFEAASTFKEAGMAIGIARNALQALELMGPSAKEALEKAGSIPHHGVKFMLANGLDACLSSPSLADILVNSSRHNSVAGQWRRHLNRGRIGSFFSAR